MNPPDIAVPIPACWTPEEALAFLVFLDQIMSAIWRAYGEQMAPHLRRIQHLARAPVTLGIHDHPELNHVFDPDLDSFPF